MNLAISHDVRNIHSYFGKGRRQKHNLLLLLSCPQATQALAGEASIWGVVSRFSLTVQRLGWEEENLPCAEIKKRNQLRYKNLKFRDTEKKKKQSSISLLAFFFSHYKRNFIHELFTAVLQIQQTTDLTNFLVSTKMFAKSVLFVIFTVDEKLSGFLMSTLVLSYEGCVPDRELCCGPLQFDLPKTQTGCFQNH